MRAVGNVLVVESSGSRELRFIQPSTQDWLEYPIFHEVQRKLGVTKLLEARAGVR